MVIYQENIMQKIIALALVATSLVAFPVATPSFAVDKGIQALCGPDAPEAYKRAGGYCDQVGSNDSLVETDDCTYYYVPSFFSLNAPAKELVVAANCYDYLPTVL
jgi:hypothetical protein